MAKKIPTKFHSDADGKPFVNCKVCHVDLTSGDIPYAVEKAYKRTSEGEDLTLFEIAICVDCAEKQSNTMSQESRDFIQKALMKREYLTKRKKIWEKGWDDNWDRRCFYTDEEIKLNGEYHVVGQFQGSSFLTMNPPIVIGQKMIEYIQENLSPETKREMDDFGKEFLGPDPRIAALLEDYQFVMV